MTVSFEEGGKEIPAEVKGVDTSSDLAVLKIDPSEVADLEVLPLGDSSKAQVGDPVVAIGNPFGLEPHGHDRDRLRRCSARSPRRTASRSPT